MSLNRLKAACDSVAPGCNWIVRFDVTGRAEPGVFADIERLSEPREGYVWIHLDRADVRMQNILRLIPDLTEEARDVLGGVIDHQFVDHSDFLISGAILDHQYSIHGPSDETDFLRFVMGEKYLITARRYPLYSANATLQTLDKNETAAAPIDLFEIIIAHLCNCSLRTARQIAKNLDKIEDNVVLEGRGRDQRATLGYARREILRLTRQISGLQSVLLRLEESSEELEHNDLIDVTARIAQRAEGLWRDISNLKDRARVLQDEINSILTLETNDRLYTLTVITALILPATFVTGFFGMNTKQLFFSESENGTVYALVLCIAASVVALLMMRWMGLTASSTDSDPARLEKR